MAFTYDPTTDRGKVRLLIYDNTDGTYKEDYFFSDADIDALLEINGDSVWYSASEACRIMAVNATSTNYLFKIPGAIELDKRKIAESYTNLADKYESRTGGGSENIIEFVDSFAIDYDLLGNDQSEYE